MVNIDLKSIREKLCLNQEEMGHILGYSRQWYNKFENEGTVKEEDLILIKMRLQELIKDVPECKVECSELFNNFCCVCMHCVTDRKNKIVVCDKTKKDVNKTKKKVCKAPSYFDIANNIDEKFNA